MQPKTSMSGKSFMCICIAILFSLSCNNAFSKDIVSGINNNPVSFFQKLEEDGDGKLVKTSVNYIELTTGLAQPLIYEHKQDHLPPLRIYYFFGKRDSSIDHIVYEWQYMDSAGLEVNRVADSSDIHYFLEKYRALCKFLAERNHLESSEGDLNDLTTIYHGDFLKRDKWINNTLVSSAFIDLYMVLSNRQEKNGAVCIEPTHHIRMTVYAYH